MGLKAKRVLSDLEKRAQQAPSGVLVDYLQTYANSLGTATAVYAGSADALALEVIAENLESISVIVKELKVRRSQAYIAPAPDLHVQALLDKFLAGQSANSTQLPTSS